VFQLFILFIYCFFIDLVRRTHDTASSDRMINEQWIWKNVKGSENGLSWGIILEGLKKTMKHLSQDSQYHRQGSNQASPEYKPEALLLEPNLFRFKLRSIK
jgi:hypothetical protein